MLLISATDRFHRSSLVITLKKRRLPELLGTYGHTMVAHFCIRSVKVAIVVLARNRKELIQFLNKSLAVRNARGSWACPASERPHTWGRHCW